MRLAVVVGTSFREGRVHYSQYDTVVTVDEVVSIPGLERLRNDLGFKSIGVIPLCREAAEGVWWRHLDWDRRV